MVTTPILGPALAGAEQATVGLAANVQARLGRILGIDSMAKAGDAVLDKLSTISEAAAPGDSPITEAVAGQVGGEDIETCRQQRRQRPPGMGRGAGPMDQQHLRALAHALHMPAQAASLDHLAGVGVGPIASIARQRQASVPRWRPAPISGHGVGAAARTA
jgi:hypothetical protein